MSQTILNLEEARELEARYATRLGEDALMRRAGAAAAAFLKERAPGRRIAFLAGPGNNGGDAVAAAIEMKRMGYEPLLVMPAAPKTALARTMLSEWLSMGGSVHPDPYALPKVDAVVDGLFGTGLSKPISGDFLDAVLWFNERQAYKLALDVPSGLDSETGLWVGVNPGCRVDDTLTFLSAKSGLFMNNGADAAGCVHVDELGTSVPLTRLELMGEADFPHVLQPRTRFSHKGDFGRVLITGGAPGMLGAPFLAARAALQLGAGSATLSLLDGRAPAFDPFMPEIMVAPATPDLRRFTTLVVGPGLGRSDEARLRLSSLIDAPIPLVLDADAINILAEDREILFAALHRQAATVITPHEGEAARILGVSPEEIRKNRVDAVRDIALKTGAITVLKGPGTLIAMRSSRAWLSPIAAPSLATAGSGDVLSGMIGALLAQRYDTMESVLAAVWLHGKAGETLDAGLTASGIAAAAARILHGERRKMH